MAGRLAARGATVVLVDVDEAGLAKTEQEIRDPGGECVIAAANVADYPQLEAAFQTAGSMDGSFQIVCNNAGIATNPPFLGELFGMPPAPRGNWRAVVDVNLSGLIAGTELGILAMRETGGVIINTASIAGLDPYPTDPIYGATKSAMILYSLTGRPR
jgi:NAD(P)-dependent dehydrogenase (short-subunit alcohol dehydrogenase family)